MAWRRRLKRTLFWGLAGSLIVLAVLVGLVQLALPWWASDAGRVARVLSARLGSPVAIEAVQPHWSPRGPLIELTGVRLGEGGDGQSVYIERAAWAIDFSGLVRPSRPFSEFRLHGLALTLVRAPDGRWSVFGLPELFKGPSDRPLASMLRALPAFALRDSRLSIRYAADKPPFELALPELRRIDGRGGARWRGRAAPLDGSGGSLVVGVDAADNGGGRLYVGGEALALADWLSALQPMGLRPLAGTLDAGAWIDFDENGVRDVQLELTQDESVWAARSDIDLGKGVHVLPHARVPPLRLGARWRRANGGTPAQLLIDELRFGDGASTRALGLGGDDGRFRLHAEDLELAPLATIAMLCDAVPPPLRRWLYVGQPSARVAGIDVDFAAGEFRQAALTLADLRTNAGSGLPGLAGFAAQVRADRDGLAVWPVDREVVLDYPGVFAAPIPFRPRTGALAFWREDAGWRLSMDQLAIEGEGYRVLLAGGLSFVPEQKPLLDLGATVIDSQIEAAKAFWPLNRIPNTARWLNRALKGGRIVRADAWIRGPADGFPFRDHGGRFEAAIDVADAGLDYHREWPELSEFDGSVAFENMSMRIRSDRADVAGVRVTGASAEVDDLKRPILRIRGAGSGSGEQLFAFLEHTPIERRYGSHLLGMRIEGEPRVEVDLRLPLKPELGESSVDGRLLFAGERFTDSKWNLDVGDLDGALVFTRTGLSAQALKLTLAGEPAQLDLRIGSSVREGGNAVEADLTGRLSIGAVFGRVEALAPLVAAAQGRADWQLDLQVPKADESNAGRIRLTSDLNGIALALPAPLSKDADSALPLVLEAGTDARDRPIDVRLGRLLRLTARHDTFSGRFAGAIALGGAEPEQLPAHGLVVTGNVPALDLGGWLALKGDGDGSSASDAAADSPLWPSVMLRAGELGVLGRAFREVDLRVEPGAEHVDIRLAGPDIDGTIVWPKAAQNRIVRGRFARLHVPPSASAELGGSLGPEVLPGLDVEADDLIVGVSRLGHTRLKAGPVDGSYRIEQFESRSAAFELDASGDWRRERGQDRSQFAIRLRADDLGAMLESFGFAGLIQGGRTQASIDGGWAGSPAAFALERIDGTLAVDVGAGRILDVDPGVGRLFGLLNLREIPRRLMLDFRDFFSQGMRFNSIEGSFLLNVGDAFTDNLIVKSPSADILITGRTGLAARDYDQTLEVTPRMGGTLPVVGALAGGPAGAAAGLVVQGLLRIDKASRIVYRVTGPWDKPEIVKQAAADGDDAEGRSGRIASGIADD